MGSKGISLTARLITWFIVGVLVIVAVKLGFWLIGVGVALLFAAIPIIIVGWLAVSVYRLFRRKPAY